MTCITLKGLSLMMNNPVTFISKVNSWSRSSVSKPIVNMTP